eukprot:2148431-Alexandrium_andersonii.AAC.1
MCHPKASEHEGSTCFATPGSKGTVRDFIFATPDLCEVVVQCGILQDCLLPVHRPVQVCLVGEFSGGRGRVLVKPRVLDDELDALLTSDPESLH